MGHCTSDTYITIQSGDERYVNIYAAPIDANEFFGKVSNAICFDDCSYDEVVEICYKGQLVHYVGWQPGMVYEYADTDGNIVWSGCFPEWDH